MPKIIPDFSLETKYENFIIAGVDEAGRGPLAGPVVAGAVIANPNNVVLGIKDSKLLSKNKRELLYQEIIEKYYWAVGIIWNEEIDQINILQATKKACVAAVENLTKKVDVVLIDGNMKFADARYISITNGDNLSHSIAAGSIIAKVTRDRLMTNMGELFPLYLWHKNAGYGTKEHIEAIKNYGLSKYHRKTFKITGYNY
ncbi:MAG: ribonuclease HII [Rickettsiaceae bacterium]|nr:MAG: ribonuclease HII [Rickettsiaceae bacterium]